MPAVAAGWSVILCEEVRHVTRRWWYVLAPVAALLIGFSGCTDDKYPDSLEYEFASHFRSDEKQALLEAQVPAGKRSQLKAMLKEAFGKPRSPKVYQADQQEQIETDPRLKLTASSLEQGSVLYRRHCVHCHGIMGDGSGPTGRLLNPRPRDFRAGAFKFRSTAILDGAADLPQWERISPTIPLPSRSDLKRTINNGIPGANMPAFNVLKDEEQEALVSYVLHLAFRGMVEYRAAKVLIDPNANPPEIPELLGREIKDYLRAVTYVPDPPKGTGSAAATARWPLISQVSEADPQWKEARELFLGIDKGNCVKCHGVDGRANSHEVPDNATRKDLWGYLAPPRNLTHGMFRGGNRPLDLFYRVRLGINGSDMPPVEKKITDQQIWLIVNYALNLSLKQN
jgi:mono/diheme cytochrome c family protein